MADISWGSVEYYADPEHKGEAPYYLTLVPLLVQKDGAASRVAAFEFEGIWPASVARKFAIGVLERSVKGGGPREIELLPEMIHFHQTRT